MTSSKWTNHFNLLRRSGLSTANVKKKTNTRLNLIRIRYGREPVSPHVVVSLVEDSIKKHIGLSVIRLGDIMALLLNDLLPRETILPFQGIPVPVPQKFFQQVKATALMADVVGVSHYPTSISLIKKFMDANNWNPPYLTDSYINDQLYYGGFLNFLIKKYRVALVGRAASLATSKLKLEGLNIAFDTSLDSYNKLDTVVQALIKHRDRFDLVLVGAGVPGRILCNFIAQQMKAPAIEVGHMMDALADPEGWLLHPDANRKKIKEFWMKTLETKNSNPVLKPLINLKATNLYTIKTGDTFYKLAKVFNISLNSLIAANPAVNPNSLKVGQKIRIPH